jgi:hypothetical protein
VKPRGLPSRTGSVLTRDKSPSGIGACSRYADLSIFYKIEYNHLLVYHYNRRMSCQEPNIPWLLPELVQLIATVDFTTWSKLCQIDRRFNDYSHTNQGKFQFAELFIVITITNNHTEYRLRGKLHRDGDLPAEIYADGTQRWYRNGKPYRDNDLPAVIYANGTQWWYRNGLVHRDGDLPTVIYADGTQGWYRDGLVHRDGDLPAVISTNGTQYWYRGGKLHRDGMPAVICADGTQYWYRNGKQYRSCMSIRDDRT